ncbi:MAG: LytTR family DNA-binding domain-containing protein [Lachnospiraceae bacterium]|nr:LytTR family DNA-binding domain-containing protein [Lachnospiraceae bacterium]
MAQIKAAVEKCILINEYNMTVSGSFCDPAACLSCINAEKPLHGIYILDIDLKAKMNGIELAAELRKTDPRAFIIFITTHEEMSLVTFQYKVEALDYIIKDSPLSLYERISDCFSNIVNKQSSLSPDETDKIHFSIHAKDYFIRRNDIYYLDTSGDHKFTVHHSSGFFETRGSLNDILPELGSDFFKCHRCCIVNLRHITKLDISNGCIYLDNEANCVCAQKYFPVLRKLLSGMEMKNYL